MLVEVGNANPHKCVTTADGTHTHESFGDGAPRVTQFHIPSDIYPLTAGADVRDVALHLVRNPRITQLPGLEAFLAIAHPLDGGWGHHSPDVPTWVHCEEEPELARLLSEFFGASPDIPANVEDTHWTRSGMPGVGPAPTDGIVALKTNAGNDIQSLQMFNAGGVLGQTGTATATTATSLTGGTEAPGGSHVANDAAGQIILAWTTGVYGLVTANTSGTSPVYTVDRWYTPGTPGGAAATTPSATAGYTLLSAAPAAYFMGLTANSTAPVGSDVTLAGEIVTSGGGLIRKICPTGHTVGAASATLTPVYVGNGSDTYPVTVAKIGVSASMVSTTRNLFQTLLNVTATLSASGDQLTVTESITE